VALPVIVQGGVQTAAHGIIQDPAGSAIGARNFNGGNASGAIYQHFNNLPDPEDHLAYIPDMPPGASAFNESKGAGRRILHSHSPFLRGSPANGICRGEALASLVNTYINAFLVSAERSQDLGNDAQLLNLVPISASLYANSFAARHPGWKVSHLDQTYTITAIQMASAVAAHRSLNVPKLCLYYYDSEVCKTAEKIFTFFAID